MVSDLAPIFCSPLLAFSRGRFVPLCPLVARAAAANVNPRTRLSHMTEFPLLLGS